MGQVEIEELLKDGKKRSEKEISKELNRQHTNIYRCLRQMLESRDICVEKVNTLVRGRNNHFYEKPVRYWFIVKIRRIRKNSKK